MEKFSVKQLQSKLSTVFNSVQANGEAAIINRSRPDMVLMLSSERDAMLEKISQLTEAIKYMDGDKKNQLDLLKGN